MEIKNMMKSKKGDVKVIDIFLVVVMVVFAFGVTFNFILDNSNEAGVGVPVRYNYTYKNLTAQQNTLEDTTNDLRDGIEDLTEPESSVQQAFGGFARGALALFKLPLNVINVGLGTLELGMDLFNFIPSSILVALTLGLTIMILFAVLRFVTQRGNSA